MRWKVLEERSPLEIKKKKAEKLEEVVKDDRN